MTFEIFECDCKYDLLLKLNALKKAYKNFTRFDVQFSTRYASGSRGCSTYYCALVIYEASKE